jgi:hypothetical protein
MDAYDGGTNLFHVALVECLVAMAMPSNPALKMIVKLTATMIGTVYSSPSDIREAARGSHETGDTVDTSGKSIDAALAQLSDDDWEKMGKEQVDAAVKKFTKEADNGKDVFHGLGDALDQLAKHSFQLGVASLSVATILLALSQLSAAGKIFPPAMPATEAATLPAGNAALATLRSMVAKGAVVYGTAAGLASMVTLILAQLSSKSLGKAANPSGDAKPEFQQVYLPDLPQYDQDGQPLKARKA